MAQYRPGDGDGEGCGEDEDEDVDGDGDPIDWPGQCRLALVVSMVAGVAAVVLTPVIGATSVIVGVIVGATCVSWFHLEHRESLASRRSQSPPGDGVI